MARTITDRTGLPLPVATGALEAATEEEADAVAIAVAGTVVKPYSSIINLVPHFHNKADLHRRKAQQIEKQMLQEPRQKQKNLRGPWILISK